MRDAEYDAQRERVKVIIDRWYASLGLKWWRTDFNWYDGPIPDAHEDAIMTCEADWRYMHATIRICVPKVAEIEDDAYLEYCMIHEFCHILVCEMRERCDDCQRGHEERVVTMLAKAFQWVRDAAMETNESEAA